MSKVLIVDDNKLNLYMLQAILKGHGYEVVQAGDGAEALVVARSDPPDIVISDILMPVMDGFALCREWKKDDQLRGIPFVFYTATYTDPKDEQFALSLGAERFVVKPAEPDVLVEILQEVLEDYEAGRLVATEPPVEEEAVYFKEYNQVLIRKLEDKLADLEEANRALRESEERCRLLLDSTAEAIYGLDFRGNCTFCNTACLRLLGYTDVHELLGRNMHQLIHHTRPDGAPYPDQECRIYRAFRQGEGVHVDDEVLWRADATCFPAEYWSYPVRRGEELVGAVVTFLDITERKQAEEALQQSEKRMKGLVEHLPEGVCLLDRDARLIFANTTAREYLHEIGYAPEEEALSHIGAFTLEEVETPREDGLPREVTVEGPPPRVFEVEAHAVAGEEGARVLLIREVTREREVQERVHQQDRLAAIGQLAAGIAHDFNNMLAVMTGTAQIMSMNPNVRDAEKADLNTIFSQGQRAANWCVRSSISAARRLRSGSRWVWRPF